MLRRSEIKRTEFKRKAVPTPKPYRSKPKPAAIKAYWDKVASLGCIVTGRTDRVTIHHVHGGSIRGVVPRGRGIKHDWMVIPLDASLHTTGPTGIDTGFGVLAWEELYGTQLHFLLEVMRRTGIDPFKKSDMPWPEGVDKPILM
jgi:hypothetical protein